MADETEETLWDRIAKALRNLGTQGDVDERAETARAGAEEASKLLPETVMPRKAVLRKRQQYADIDAMFENADAPPALRAAAARRRALQK